MHVKHFPHLNQTRRVHPDRILSAIGSTVSDDPTLPGDTGIAKPLDVQTLHAGQSAPLGNGVEAVHVAREGAHERVSG
jgi:hypothetical protein